MLRIYYAHIDTLSYDLLMKFAANNWNNAIQDSITRYKYQQDRLLTAAGKLLLTKALQEMQLSTRLSVNELAFTAYQKPVFDYPIDFSISHGGHYALLSITTEGKTGIDIEMIQPVNKEEFTDIFTTQEWNALVQAPADQTLFYHLWTRKEAVVKAAGKGLHLPLAEIDVMNNIVMAEQARYQLANLLIDPQYMAHCAVSSNLQKWPLPQKVDLNDCIRDLFI